MSISNYERKRRKAQKELKSFRNRMGKHIVWFDSLPELKQYGILFGWKKEKKKNKLEHPEYKLEEIFIRKGWKIKKTKIKKLVYPASLKHYIQLCRHNPKYRPSKTNVREAAIDILLKTK